MLLARSLRRRCEPLTLHAAAGFGFSFELPALTGRCPDSVIPRCGGGGPPGGATRTRGAAATFERLALPAAAPTS